MSPTFENITRAESKPLNEMLGLPHKCLDHGFVRVVDYMGDEGAVAQAARVSYGMGTKTVSKDAGLMRYLMRHWHTTPFEMCEIKLHVKLPVFVARQWIRHRTANVNEMSARYSILPGEFYIPNAGDLAPQSTENKQGREGSYSDIELVSILDEIEAASVLAYKRYKSLSDSPENDGYGLARELSRMVLPTNIYTEWYWKVDLHNLLHFLRLRADAHAQYEIRAYADVIADIVQQWVPSIWQAHLDYRVNAHTFSGQEMDILRAELDRLRGIANDEGIYEDKIVDFSGLSEREAAAFRIAVGQSE